MVRYLNVILISDCQSAIHVLGIGTGHLNNGGSEYWTSKSPLFRCYFTCIKMGMAMLSILLRLFHCSLFIVVKGAKSHVLSNNSDPLNLEVQY